MYFVVNDFVRSAKDDKPLVHADSNKRGYPNREAAESAARRINQRLVERGLVRQASVKES